MVLLLMECAGDEMDTDGGTEMWLNMIDRGGLWHVNDQTYSNHGRGNLPLFLLQQKLSP